MSQFNFFGQDKFAVCRFLISNGSFGINFLLFLVQNLLIVVDLGRQGSTLCYFGNRALAVDSAIGAKADHEVGDWPSQGDIVGLEGCITSAESDLQQHSRQE